VQLLLASSGVQVLFLGDNFARLMRGFGTSLSIAGLALLIGIPLGIVLGSLRTLRNRPVRFILRVYLEIFRIIPTLVILYLAFYILPEAFGVQIDSHVTAVVAFGLWVSAEMSDIVRGAFVSVPEHQVETAKALGMNGFQILWHVRIPQSISLVIPAAINLAARAIMTTSLLSLILVIDVVNVGQQIMEANRMDYPDSAFWVYGFIFILYFICCWLLASVAKYLERRSRRNNE
jgi:polar amino acid transport system permease protein